MQQVNLCRYQYDTVCNHLIARKLCTDGEVRLEDKESEYVGRVGLCYRGEWGSVFDYKINDNAAAVVCRQLEHGQSIK